MEVHFRTDDAQLLGLWTAIRLLGESRGLEDRRLGAEFLTKAQILLTAFVIGLEPLGPDLAASAPVGIGRGQIARFDA
jgi:hypothetical protein